MKGNLDEFINGLEKLRDYISGVKLQNELLASNLEEREHCEIHNLIEDIKEHHMKFRTKKVFEYNTIIISLYGFFERYLEEIIKGYLNELNNIIDEFSNLPNTISENHHDLSAQLLRNIELPKYQGVISKNEIIKNLYSCINNDEFNYKINLEAYTYHSSNFRHEEINRFFSNIGINNISHLVKQDSKFKKYMNNNYPEINLSNTRDKIVFNKLDDLANRRNDVAHGSVGQILNLNLLLEYIDFLEVYGNALFNVLYDKILSYEVKYNSVKLNSPIKIYNNKIIILELENTKIAVGDKIIAERKSNYPKYLYGNIKELQIDGESCQIISEEKSINIGMEINFKAKENQSFYLNK